MDGSKYNKILLSFLILCSLPILSPGCKKSPTTAQVENFGQPVIWVNQYDVTFMAATAIGNPDSQTIKIKNSGKGILDYKVTTDKDWLQVNTESGSSSGEVNSHSLKVDVSGMSPQDKAYTANLVIDCPEAYNNPQKITVNLKLSKNPPPAIQVSPQDLVFNAQKGSKNPSGQTFIIQNSGSGILQFDLDPEESWIKVDPNSGQSKSKAKTILVSVRSKDLKVGTYRGKIRVKDPEAANSPQFVSVKLNVTKEPPPKFDIDPKNLSFIGTEGGSNPAARNILIGNSGGGTLQYTISNDVPWLTVGPNSGSTKGSPNMHTVSVRTGGMTKGKYTGTIRISSPDAANNPQTVTVTLELTTVVPPSTDNAIGISLSPISAVSGTTVTVNISVRGNLQQIKVFGLEVHFDTNMFSYVSTSKGSKTGNWAAVAGNEISAGTLKIGGFMGSGTPIAVGSSGTIAVIKLRVTGSSFSNGQSSPVTIDTFTDDLAGMSASPGSSTFSIQK